MQYRPGLAFSITATLACILILTWIMLSIIAFKTSEQDIRLQKIEESRLLSQTIILLLPEVISKASAGTALKNLSTEVLNTSSLISISIVDNAGHQVFGEPPESELIQTVKSQRDNFRFSQSGGELKRYTPVYRNGLLAGAVRISLSLSKELERVNRSRSLFFIYFILDFILLLSIGSWLVVRIAVIPLKNLALATEKIASGDLEHYVHSFGSRELSNLANSFNVMVNALRDRREELKSHLKELERVNAELKSAKEESIRNEKLASVGILAAGMAHEIGTPLSTVLGYAELGIEITSDEQLKDYLSKIVSEGDRIDRLVRELLDFAKPSPPELEWISPQDLIYGLLDMLERQGAIKRINCSFKADGVLPDIYADRDKLTQVMLNLILNARDAMPEGGELKITAQIAEPESINSLFPKDGYFALGRRGGDFRGAFNFAVNQNIKYLKIDLSDTGEGITHENISRIFDPFFTTKEPGKGTGLGLSIVAGIVDSMQGRITVESKKGEGAQFSLWLPLGKEPSDE